jgi:DNA-binding beta-propeller fold protein YncE
MLAPPSLARHPRKHPWEPRSGLARDVGDGDGPFNRPAGMAFNPEGHLHVVDSFNHRVQLFSRDGKCLGRWGTQGSAPGELHLPMGIATDDEGDVYVADWGNHRLQTCTADRVLQLVIGSEDRERSQFVWSTGVAVMRVVNNDEDLHENVLRLCMRVLIPFILH